MDHLKTVFIADAAEEFCASLCAALKQAGGFQVVGTAADGETAGSDISETADICSNSGSFIKLAAA